LLKPYNLRAYITFAGTSGAASGQLKFGGSGKGDIDVLKGHLPEDNIVFALARVSDKIDMSVTVKFVHINWVGPKTPRMMQSKLSVQLGAIKAFFMVRLCFLFYLCSCWLS